MEPFVGQIVMFAGIFAPRGWALCEGQLLEIERYQLLYGLLGTAYGGDGQTTFALPDLRGRMPVGCGAGPERAVTAAAAATGAADAVPEVPAAAPQDGAQPGRYVSFIIALDGVYPSRT